MEDCIFCKIINKEINSNICYEDDEIIAFEDIAPVAPIHTLVIPKQHISDLTELNDENIEIVSKIYKVINMIAKEKGIEENGYRVIVNCKEDGGQEVKHLHFHLIGGKKLGTKIAVQE